MKTICLLVFLSSTIAGCGLEEKAKKDDAKTQAVTDVAVPAPAEATPGKDGADGANGKDGVDGRDGAAGVGLLGVYANKQLIGYYLGDKEVELLSGALGYFDFSTGETLGAPILDRSHSADEAMNNICYYESNDCTGECWVNTNGGRPQPGFIFSEGDTMWRIDGDEREVTNFSFLSYRASTDTKCHYTSEPGMTSAMAMEHKEKIPAGLTIPFGKLSFGKVK